MARVFVGNLPTRVHEDELERVFDKYGRIRAVSIKYPQRPPPFAFIEYVDERDASDAVRAMHGRDFMGARLRVEISHGGDSARDSSSLDNRLRGTQFRVRLSNLAPTVSWQVVKDFLRDGGDVAHADVDRRGNGVASFATFDDMERAVRTLDGAELAGERVRIREERDSDDGQDTDNVSGGAGTSSRSRTSSRHRSRSRSRSPRGRSRSRSHSRSRSPHRRSRSRSRSPVRSNRRDRSRSRSASPSRRSSSSRRRSRSRSRSRSR